MSVQSETPPPPQQGPRLVDIEVNNENQALNLLVSFLGLAQRRGAFSLDEAAKIFECVKVFQPPPPPTENTVLPTVPESTDESVENSAEVPETSD